MEDEIIVVSTNDIAGSEIVEYIGLVQGSTVRALTVLP